MATVCMDMGIHGFFLSAVDLKKRQNRVAFPGFLGCIGLFIPLRLALGGTFVMCTWGRRFIHSWLWDGAWMVAIWGGVGEQWRLGDLVNGVKTFYLNAYYNSLGVFFHYFFKISQVLDKSYQEIVLGFQTGPPGRPACCADKGYPV